MENESRLGGRFNQWKASVSDFLSEQEWFQQLETKWAELDPQSRVYLKFALSGLAAFLFLALVFSSFWNVRSLKGELREKSELLALIQSANDELHRLKETGAGSASGEESGNEGGAQAAVPWPSYIESIAANFGIDKAALSISPEKAGTATDSFKESLFDVSLKKVNIKQVVRFAHNLENGARPAKVRNLSIDTNADPSGYVDASIAVSTFTLINNK